MGGSSDAAEQIDSYRNKSTYTCPRCSVDFADWRGMRQHLRKEAKCRSTVDLSKPRAAQKQCRSKLTPHAPPTGFNNSASETVANGSPVVSPSAMPPRQTCEANDSNVDCASGEIEENVPCPTGIGAGVSSLHGSFWGYVVSEDTRSWHLQNGRKLRKAMEQKTWIWAQPTRPSDSDMSPAYSTMFSPLSQCSPDILSLASCNASPFLLPQPSASDIRIDIARGCACKHAGHRYWSRNCCS